MSAKVRSSEAAPMPDLGELEVANCECCGLMEECTPAYVEKIRAGYHGRWICGLCSEAVKDEIHRSGWAISTEEAMDRHRSFRSVSPPAKSAEHLLAAVSRILRRSLSSPAIPRRKVAAAAEEEVSSTSSPPQNQIGNGNGTVDRLYK